jgi:phosphoribosylglycinamide formyltransferase-1
MKGIVVLVSGDGSNLQAVIDACQRRAIAATVDAVISNNPQAFALQRAKDSGISAHAVDSTLFDDRQAFDDALIALIDRYQPKLVVLAGYMRILSPHFVQHYLGRLINIHPSLLPKYPGLHTHRQVLANGDRQHGSSIHFVTEQLDGGPIILRAKIDVSHTDTVQSLEQRIKRVEHQVYPKVIDWFMQNRLVMRQGTAWLDGINLAESGHREEIDFSDKH